MGAEQAECLVEGQRETASAGSAGLQVATASAGSAGLRVRHHAADAALNGSLVTASVAPWVDMHRSPCKRKEIFEGGTDDVVLDGSSAPSEKRLRVELGVG